MTYRDFLLPIPSYPDPTPPGPIKAAFDLAKQFGAAMTAVLLELDAQRSAWPSSFGTHLANISGLVGEALTQSRDNSRKVMDQMRAEASRSFVDLNILREPTTVFPSPSCIVERARLHDLTILSTTSGFDRWFNEAVVFESGAPVLLLPDEWVRVDLDTVVVAWDFSFAASRALRAALPLLSLASNIRLFTITNEKNSTANRSIEDVQRHLSLHNISFGYDEVDLAGRTIGESFRDYAKSVGANVLVMGAFGHSRVREFVLGGATESMLISPMLPVLLAH